MNDLSKRAALRCETAQEPQCRCRCGGMLHGAKRTSTIDGLYSLPEGDPHHLLTDDEKRERKRKAADEVSRKRAEARAAVYAANNLWKDNDHE